MSPKNTKRVLEILKEHYKKFKILGLWEDDKGYYCFLGENKVR
jgi:hypothetical protein